MSAIFLKKIAICLKKKKKGKRILEGRNKSYFFPIFQISKKNLNSAGIKISQYR